MATKKISELPVAIAVSGTDLVPVVDGGATKSCTVAQIQGAPANTSSFSTDPNGKVLSFVEPTFVTTNATPTNCATAIYAMPDLTLADIIVTVVGKKAASADHYVRDFRGRYTRNGGAPVLSGSVIAGSNVDASGTLATATATLVISGNNIVPQVTGVAATNITWSATLQVQPVTTAT